MSSAIDLCVLLVLTGCAPGLLNTAEPPPSHDWPSFRLAGLEQAWSLKLSPDKFGGGIAADQNVGAIYSLAPAAGAQNFKTCFRINAEGKFEREFKFQKYNMILRTAHLHSTNVSDLLTF